MYFVVLFFQKPPQSEGAEMIDPKLERLFNLGQFGHKQVKGLGNDVFDVTEAHGRYTITMTGLSVDGVGIERVVVVLAPKTSFALAQQPKRELNLAITNAVADLRYMLRSLSYLRTFEQFCAALAELREVRHLFISALERLMGRRFFS